MTQISRRLFIKGGLAALVVAACGDGTRLVSPATLATSESTVAATGTAVTTGSAAPAASLPVVVDVMGEYSIVDSTFGTRLAVTLDDA